MNTKTSEFNGPILSCTTKLNNTIVTQIEQRINDEWLLY